MPGTNPGGDDPRAPTELNVQGSTDEPSQAPQTPPISEAEQSQRNDDRINQRRLLLSRLKEESERSPLPEDPEPSPFIENDWLPPGWEWREGASGIVLPIAPPPDPNEPATVIIRFLDHAKGTINGRPVCPGTVAEIDSQTAKRLFAYRPMGLPSEMWPAKVEYATPDDLSRYETVMLDADKNEEATAKDPLSQQLGMVPLDTPKLIVRFIQGGWASDKRSCGIGEVWPVEKELAVRHLLEKKPVVELATPEDLKRDRDTIDHSESQSKSQVDARRKRRFKKGIPHSGPSTLIVRFLTPGRFSIHMNQGVIYEHRSEGCETLPCAAGEIWEVTQDFAYRMLRGKSPACVLATDAEWEAYRAKLIGEPVSVEPAKQVLTGKDRKTPKTKKNSDDTGSRTKFIAILSKHHRYSEDNGLWLEPIESSELVRQSGFAKSTVSEFFKKEFGSPAQYQRDCRESSSLKLALQALRGEISPRKLRQGGSLSSVPNRDEREDD